MNAHPMASSPAANTTRLLALGFFVFVALSTGAVWYLVQSFGPAYFFAVHFLLALGIPFLLYGIGGRRPWFEIGMFVSAGVMAFLNWWGAQAQGFDWTHAFSTVLGLALAWAIHLVYAKIRQPHGATPRYG